MFFFGAGGLAHGAAFLIEIAHSLLCLVHPRVTFRSFFAPDDDNNKMIASPVIVIRQDYSN